MIEMAKSNVIDVYLEPIKAFLNANDIIEISINKPGELFVERAGVSHMERHECKEISQDWFNVLAQQIAQTTSQFVNAEAPLLSASLPSGERVQVILAPAAADGGALSIRKQYIKKLTLREYAQIGAMKNIGQHGNDDKAVQLELSKLLDRHDYLGFIEKAIANRISILVSGGTQTGKTTFLNACLNSIPLTERIITIQDTLELTPPHQNLLNLLASKGTQGTAVVSMQDLLEACLRLRPDRVLIGELRGSEAFTFLRAVNTGHPGSMTTVHANTPEGAYHQLMLMVLQSDAGQGLDHHFIKDYIKTVMPIVIQLRRVGAERGVSEIYYHDYTKQ